MIGWIKLHRKITEHWIWSKPEYLQWWIDILIQANFESKKVLIKSKLLECPRGDVLYSYDTWAKRWKCSKSKAMRFLILLEKDSMIVLKNETVTTRLTICKYDSYQDERNDSETQVKRKRNASETQVKPTKESKEIKNDKNDILNAESHNEIFRKLWKNQQWLESLCMKWKCEIQDLQDHLNTFRTECIDKDELKVDEKDAKTHFINWVKKGNDVPVIARKNASLQKDNWW